MIGSVQDRLAQEETGMIHAKRWLHGIQRLKHLFSVSLAWLTVMGHALAQTVPPPAPRPQPCASAEHRAFDFWAGDWVVYGKAGKLAGENRIEKRHGGCMLHESYKTPSGYSGESINMYDSSRKRWYQTWADNGGLLLRLEGGLVEGSMVLEGESLLPNGRPQAQRITWTPNADGTVRQHWEAKNEQGQWTTQFDGTYRRK